MKKENELKDLLDRLKGEVRRSSGFGPGHPEVFLGRAEEEPEEFAPPMPAKFAGMGGAPRAPRPEPFRVPGRQEFTRPERIVVPAGANLIWSENKEAMLFGVLASLVAILGGILAGLDYVILVGAVSFMLFSFIMCLTLFGYYLNFRRKNSEEGRLGERVDQLSRRLEAMAMKGPAGPSQGGLPARGKDKELEQRVDELRTLVKSLARAVEKQNGEAR